VNPETYPEVSVVGAPGYEDFTGWLLMETPRADGVPMSVVGFEQEGERDFALFQSQYVEMI
jgi:hypothetical protein